MYDELKRRHISIVEEVVKQHHDMSRINPDSVNTIRVYTVLTDGKANAIYACIRMGNSDRPVDNINAGGMYSPIDMKTGKIAFPACDKQRKVYEKHPRSGCELKGYQIPFWEESIAMCCEAAENSHNSDISVGMLQLQRTDRCLLRRIICPDTTLYRKCRCKHPIKSAFYLH